MTRLLESVYFGHLDRGPFFVLVAGLSAAAAVLVSAALLGGSEGEGAAVLAAIGRSASVIDTPGILVAHGVSEHRTAGVMTLVGLYLIAMLFALAARARDIGLWGWPTAFAALPVFLFVSRAEPWVASLGVSLMFFFFLWPSRSHG
ncbi:MAG: hypothetical protein AAGC57_07975 [Pseudomonadota bacterium]